MEINKWGTKAAKLVKKYRYGILVLLIGLILMLLPTGTDKETDDSASTTTPSSISYGDITEELKQILSSIQGVGEVKVMLTIAAGEQTVYQEDESISTSENSSTIQKETVILTDSDRQQQALVSYVKPPTYLGVIVVCQGADQPAVKLAVIDAVSKITGLSSDKISVVKMK